MLSDTVAIVDAILSRVTAIEYVIENNADHNAQKSVFVLCGEIRRLLNVLTAEERKKENAPVQRLESADGKYAILCYHADQVRRARELILCDSK